MKLHWVQKPSITIFWWDTGLWFHPIWKICSSNWTSAPNMGENQKNIWNHLVIFRWWIRHQPGIHLTSWKNQPISVVLSGRFEHLFMKENDQPFTPPKVLAAWGVPNRQQWLACWTAWQGFVETHPSGVFFGASADFKKPTKKDDSEKTEMTFLLQGKLKVEVWKTFYVFHVFWKDFLFEGAFFGETTFIFFESLWRKEVSKD